MSNPFWTQARSQMLLDPSVANLNTGSFGPLPRMVFERVTELRRRLAEEPMDFLLRQAPSLLWEARERLAQFLGADPSHLAFAANVTAAVNVIAAGLRLTAPGEILLTDHEYGAMHWCWERAAQRQGLSLRIARLPLAPFSQYREPASGSSALGANACGSTISGKEIVEAIQKEISERTRLLFFSHVLSPTGLVLPAKELCTEARRRGVVTVIDGAHAPAMIPLQIRELGCDFYTGNCHKWLLAPTGAGFLHFSPGSEDRLAPLQVSWGWHYDRTKPDQRDEFGSTPRLRAFEFEGTRDPCAWLAVPAAIDFQAGLGWEKIRARIAELTGYVRKRLSVDGGLPAATPAEPALHGAMTAFWLPHGTDAGELRRRLWQKHRIEAPIIDRPQGLLLRVSTHFFNTEEEIDRLAEAFRN